MTNNPNSISLEGVIELIKANLRIEVKTTSEYIGSMGDGGSMYKDFHTLTMTFGGEVISEVSL